METSLGYIIFPENQQDIVYSVRLEISDNLILIEIPDKEMLDKYDILLGVFNGIGNVTFVDCNSHGFSSGGGAKLIKLSAKYLLKGAHLSSIEELSFKRCIVNFPSLIKWLGISLIDSQFKDNREIITIDQHKDIDLGLIDGFYFSFGFGYSSQTKRRWINIKEDFFLKINSEDGNISIFQFLYKISIFKKFLIFVANLSAETESIVFYRDDLVYNPSIPQLNKPISIELLFGFSETKHDETWYSPSIKYNQIEMTLPKIYREWSTNKDLAISIDLLLEKSFNPRLSRENYFLNSCFSIETLLRRYRKLSVIKDNEFQKLILRIKSEYNDPVMIEFIEEKLVYSNEPTFRDRLLNIEPDFIKLLPTHFNAKEYIKKVVKTRNFLVHRSNEKGIFKGLELFYSAKYIETIVKINVFRLIGISDDLINHELTHSKNYIHNMFLHNKRLQKSIGDEIV